MMNIFKINKYFEWFMPSFGGAEGLILSAALSGVGALMQKQAADDAAKRQDRIIRQGQEEDARISQQKQATIQNFAEDNFSTENRMANYEAGATKNESDLVGALKQANEGKNDIKRTETEGTLSADYLRSKGEATAAATDDILKRARLLGRANAGGLLYNKDTMATNQLNADTAGFNSMGQRNRDYTNTRVNAARNRGSLVGGLLQGVAPMAGAAGQKWWNANMWGGV